MYLEFFLYSSFIFWWFRWCIKYGIRLFLFHFNHFTLLFTNLFFDASSDVSNMIRALFLFIFYFITSLYFPYLSSCPAKKFISSLYLSTEFAISWGFYSHQYNDAMESFIFWCVTTFVSISTDTEFPCFTSLQIMFL